MQPPVRSSMLLMIEKHFQKAPFTWKQRAAFWEHLYYMSSAALPLTGPFPTLTMIWFYPQHVYPHNYLPTVLRQLFVFPLLSRGWRPTILAGLRDSCCQTYGGRGTRSGRVAERVLTGASPDGGQVPVTVKTGSYAAGLCLFRRPVGPGTAGARVRLAAVPGQQRSWGGVQLYTPCCYS